MVCASFLATPFRLKTDWQFETSGEENASKEIPVKNNVIVRDSPDTEILFSPTVRERAFRIILAPMTGLAVTSSEGRMAASPGRSYSGLEEMMHHQRA